LPKEPNTTQSCSFSHIFAGGYGAGYYSYKWAEVLDADAFEYFKEQGLFNSKVAAQFKNSILSRGGTDHPMKLYVEFRGREPDANSLLRRDGLI
jgi:peptidyl-dipeptidase Dcp